MNLLADEGVVKLPLLFVFVKDFKDIPSATLLKRGSYFDDPEAKGLL